MGVKGRMVSWKTGLRCFSGACSELALFDRTQLHLFTLAVFGLNIGLKLALVVT